VTNDPSTPAAPRPKEGAPKKKRRPYVRVVGPRLAKLLALVFALFALTSINSLYLVSVTFLQWVTGVLYENWFYHLMSFGHLVLGLLLTLPLVLFGIIHIRNSHDRPNRRAVRAGYALFAVSLILLATGFLLVRMQGFAPVKDAATRSLVYWAHVVTPLLAAWLFILHRLAGKRIQWKIGLRWGIAGAVLTLGMLAFHSRSPQTWDVVGPKEGAQYFLPALSRTATGDFIPAEAMLNDAYCLECHADVHAQWSTSAHKFSSFNNPIYLFSVLNTRKKMFERDGSARGSRFCAACHDPVPFFSGAFDDPKFDDPDYDLAGDPQAQAGITCTVCHSITKVNDNRGNGSYTIEEARHYPFAYSENPLLKWINRQMILAKPAFHKKTFLKPLHKTPEFCGTCHKVHLPKDLNAYKWLRGQNHFDSYHLSGVSGHGVSSFYYPQKAEASCNGCHMPLEDSEDFGAQDFGGRGRLQVHDHMFPSANTGLADLLGLSKEVLEKHKAFNEGVMRVDLFGVKKGGTIDGELIAPLRPAMPTLVAGERYLLETVIRTLKMGHLFTEGTADSNEVWLDVTVKNGDRVIGRSGGRNDEGEVDPWSHFVNAFVIDRDGKRIDRRNAEDIFIALYNNQIPPGAGSVVHFLLQVPKEATGTITVDVKLQYRKFDTTLLKLVQGADFVKNSLPVMTLAEDHVEFQIGDGSPQELGPVDTNTLDWTSSWQRENDYGIGLLLKAGNSHKGELRQAEAAFQAVEKRGRPDGPLNLARVYLREGRLEEAVAALQRAAAHEPPAPPWSIAWFTGLVNKQNGYLDEALANFRQVVEMDTAEMRERGFDFSQDYRVTNELGQTLFERAKQERRDLKAKQELLLEAISWFEKTLAFDAENMDAHWNLALLFTELGDEASATRHRDLHARYKPDDNASGRAVAAARKAYPAADHAANVVVIHDLAREGAYELAPK
jgi:tetratricopeptide (TPR) repeat protein